MGRPAHAAGTVLGPDDPTASPAAWAGISAVFPGSGKHGGGPPARVSMFRRYQRHRLRDIRFIYDKQRGRCCRCARHTPFEGWRIEGDWWRWRARCRRFPNARRRLAPRPTPMTPPPAQPAAPYHAGNSAVAVAAPGNQEIRRWRFRGGMAPCQPVGLQLVELIREGRISASIPLADRPAGRRVNAVLPRAFWH